MSKRPSGSDAAESNKKPKRVPAAAAAASSSSSSAAAASSSSQAIAAAASSSMGSRCVAAATQQAQLVHAFQVVVSNAFELMELKGLCSVGMDAVLDIVFGYCAPSFLEQICEDGEPLHTLSADHCVDLSPKFRKAIHDVWHLYAHNTQAELSLSSSVPDKHMDVECVRLLLMDMCGRGQDQYDGERRLEAGRLMQEHGEPRAPRRLLITVHGLEEYFFRMVRPGNQDKHVRHKLRKLSKQHTRRSELKGQGYTDESAHMQDADSEDSDYSY